MSKRDPLDEPLDLSKPLVFKHPWWEYVRALRSGDPEQAMVKAAMGVPALEKVNNASRMMGIVRFLRRTNRDIERENQPPNFPAI